MTRSSIFDSSASSRLQLESAIRSSQQARQLTQTDAELVLAYCKWLYSKEFLRQSNANMQKCGVAPRTPTVFLHAEAASPIYGRILREIQAELGFSLLGIGEPSAVEAAIRARKATAAPTVAVGPMKTAEFRMSRIQKFVGGGKRVVRGIASTPTTDRMGDIVEPLGGTWKTPLPLLWQHRHDTPVGWVRSVKASRAGLEIEAEVAEGVGRADETWQMIELGLLDSFSIGFRAITTEPIATGVRFKTWELYEISIVTVPANADAKIRRSERSSRSERAKHTDGVPLVAGAVRLIGAGAGSVKLGGR